MLRGRRGRPQRVRRRPSGISTRRIREDARRGGAAAAPRIVRGRSSNGRKEGLVVAGTAATSTSAPPGRRAGARRTPWRRTSPATSTRRYEPRCGRTATSSRARGGGRGPSDRRSARAPRSFGPSAGGTTTCAGPDGGVETSLVSATRSPLRLDFCGVGPRASRSLYGHSTRRRRRLSRRYLRDLADGGFTCDEGAHKAGLVEALARTSGHLDHRTVQFRLKSHLPDARTVGDL